MKPTICSWDGIEATRGKRIASRTVVDDFGTEHAMRQCGVCWRTLPEDYENFSPQVVVRHEVKRYSSVCRNCVRDRAKRWWHGLDEDARAEQLQRRYDYARTEHGKAANRISKRKWERANRERVNALQRKYRRRVRLNARKTKRKREAERIRKRVIEERKGRNVTEIRASEAALRSPRVDTAGAFPRLPARPLALAIDASDARRRQEFYAGFVVNYRCSTPPGDYTPEFDTLGLAERADSAGRMVYAWRIGERLEANFDTVDAALSRGRWLWWEVYNPDTVRRYALTVAIRRKQTKKNRTDRLPVAIETEDGWRVRFTTYTTAERRFYGDLGTDWQTLWEVEHAFTCEGIDHCWACWYANEADKARKRAERAQRQGEQMVLAEAA